MKIYTSYYSKLSNINTDNCTIIKISNTKPYWFTKPCKSMECLYPHWDLINGLKEGSITVEEFKDRYFNQLDNFGRDNIYNMLKELSDNKVIILVCWENPRKFCHRSLIGEYLNLDITELNI